MNPRDKVRTFITTNYYVSDPTALRDEVSLLDAGIIDSTGVLELVTFLQEDFGIQVEDSEIIPDNLDTIERILAFVGRKKG